MRFDDTKEEEDYDVCTYYVGSEYGGLRGTYGRRRLDGDPCYEH